MTSVFGAVVVALLFLAFGIFVVIYGTAWWGPIPPFVAAGAWVVVAFVRWRLRP